MANEKRLISLDEALKATHREIYWTESQQAAVRSFLVKQPKVDAVEVVRELWIPVTEKLPEEPLQTILVTNGKMVCVAVYSVVYEEFGVMCGKCRGQAKSFGVTHWMPLPLPPIEV